VGQVQFEEKLFLGAHPLEDEVIRSDAGAAGLDGAAFDAARRDPTLAESVKRSETLAPRVGADGTPTFFVTRYARPCSLSLL